MDPSLLNNFGIPAYFFLWAATLTALVIFTRRVIVLIKLLRSAKSENLFDNISARLKNVLQYVFGQKKLLEEPLIGIAHLLIFWGFILFAITFWWNLLRGLFPFLPIPYADDIGWIQFFLEIFALFVLSGIIVSAIRRFFFPPLHLQKTTDAIIILTLIASLMITFLLQQGFRFDAELHSTSELNILESFGMKIISFAGFDTLTSHNASAIMFLSHQALVLFFLAYLPHSKHLHLLASPFNVFFSNIKPNGVISIPAETNDEFTGAAKWNEFTWKQLLNAFSCAECGRCDRACPVVATNASFSPRLLIHYLKENVLASLKNGKSAHQEQQENKLLLLGGEISSEEVWQCFTCGLCMERCPVKNEHLSILLQLRRRLVNEGIIDKPLQDALKNVLRYGNLLGKSERMRPKWTEGLEFKIKDARKEHVEYLWFVGDFASYDPRLQEITRQTARIFNDAGIDFGILYEGECNAGNDTRRTGEEGLYETLKAKNMKTLQKAMFDKIVTTDPHTYNTLKNEYFNSDILERKIEVLHYTELLEQLLADGHLKPKHKIHEKVTYQDPCYLGRYNGIYDSPRNVLHSLGITLKEMPRNKANSYCCGAGGGRIWLEDKIEVTERPAENRIREIIALDGVNTLVTACPKDIIMFRDAIKTTGSEEMITVKDIAEIVWEAMRN